MSGSVARKQGWNRKKGDPALPGAGRPKGALNRKTKLIRAAAMGALRPGKTPLDIMLKNMRFYDEKAEAMMTVLEEKLANRKTLPEDLLKLLSEMSGYRMSAQKCAVEAAPYVHPKLASIEHKVDNTPIQAKSETAMSDEELADYYNKLRLRPTSVEPLSVVVLDNETGDPVRVDEDEDDA